MDQQNRIKNICQWLEEASPITDLIKTYPAVPPPVESQVLPWSDKETNLSLEQIEESLAHAYLAANLNLKNIPLKAFMDGFEKKILLSCLRLAQGNQKNVAAVLSLKPTALFAKMRKHGIYSRRKKPAGKAVTAESRDTA
jgi:DNA-binding NtrC family response regulator